MSYQPSTFLVELRKTTKTLNKNKNSSRDLSLYHPEYAIKRRRKKRNFLPAAIWALGSIQPLTEMSTRNISGG
jgi:hypothetical protein